MTGPGYMRGFATMNTEPEQTLATTIAAHMVEERPESTPPRPFCRLWTDRILPESTNTSGREISHGRRRPAEMRIDD